MSNENDFVILVDEQDNEIGQEEKLKAHQAALLHRAFSVIIYRRQNGVFEFLLQQRHIDKYHCGGLWTNTCCSHPRPGETVLDAGRRRLKEELSLDVPLTHIGSFSYKAHFDNGLTEYELDHVLIGEYNPNQEIKLHPEEVQDVRWVAFSVLMRDLMSNPKIYTPWLKPALKLLLSSELSPLSMSGL
jgi:isopentenyl-diphosphate delta-isomerase type 1